MYPKGRRIFKIFVHSREYNYNHIAYVYNNYFAEYIAIIYNCIKFHIYSIALIIVVALTSTLIVQAAQCSAKY